MPYPPMMVQPMRDELTKLGFRELTSAEEVDRAVAEASEPMLLVVNSICGCAAGVARPGVAQSLRSPAAPKNLATVFAGQDIEATARARSFFEGYPPSSPQVAILSGVTRSKAVLPNRSLRRSPPPTKNSPPRRREEDRRPRLRPRGGRDRAGP